MKLLKVHNYRINAEEILVIYEGEYISTDRNCPDTKYYVEVMLKCGQCIIMYDLDIVDVIKAWEESI